MLSFAPGTRHRQVLTCLAVVMTLGCFSTSLLAAAQTVRQYAIGNSLTGLIGFDKYAQLVQSRGNGVTWGNHIQPGAGLDTILATPSDGQTISEPPYGTYGNALPNYNWDAVAVEPFGRVMEGPQGDLASIHGFANLVTPHNPNAQLYIYQTWPVKQSDGSLNYHDNWLSTYDGTADDSVRSRNYFDQLMTSLRSAAPSMERQALMIPVGEVLFNLNEKMHAGQVAGYTDISAFYSDGIHLNPMGAYTSALTWYATLFKDDPHGLSGAAWGVTDPVLQAAIQDSAWQVVNASQWTGGPEPASLGLFSIAGALGLTARRRRAA